MDPVGHYPWALSLFALYYFLAVAKIRHSQPYPFIIREKVCLLGDAAHPVRPFSTCLDSG